MKWVIIIYLAIWTNTPDAVKHTRLEFPATDFQECIDIEHQINDLIHRGRESKTKYVRSLYWEYKNTLGDIKAECVFANSPIPYSKWFSEKQK